MGLVLLLAAQAMAGPLAPSALVFCPEDATLRGSRWGPVGELQDALACHLEECGQAPIDVDGCFGPATREGLMRLGWCVPVDVPLPSSNVLDGAITAEEWEVFVGTPVPDARARAFVMVLTHEGTDFDRVVWNLRTRDDSSILTWGPFGATVGHGGEVQAILARLRRRDEGVLREAFGNEAATALRLSRCESATSARRLLAPVHVNRSRRRAWLAAFRALGARADVRDEYMAYALESDAWLRPPMRRLETLLPDGVAATEVDRAFFLDLAVQCRVDAERIAVARERLRALERDLGRAPDAAERRRCIGETWTEFVSPAWRDDRRARNVAFTIDELVPTEEERLAWSRRRTRASAAGLSDDRPAD